MKTQQQPLLGQRPLMCRSFKHPCWSLDPLLGFGFVAAGGEIGFNPIRKLTAFQIQVVMFTHRQLDSTGIQFGSGLDGRTLAVDSVKPQP